MDDAEAGGEASAGVDPAEMRAERELLAELVDDSPDAIVRIDLDGRIEFVNAAWHDFFGLRVPDPLGRTLGDVGLAPEQVESLDRRVADAIRQGTSAVELYRLTDERGSRWLEMRVVPGHSHTDEIDHVLLLVRDVTQQHAAEEELTAAAASDPLTGLANRRLMLDAIRRQVAAATRAGRVVGVLYLDLDHFKDVNDSFGHRTGDELLKAVGQRLETVVRPSDLVGRQGGDEFIVLVSAMDDATEIERVAERLLACFAEPLEAAGERFQVSTSIGVALASSTDRGSEDLLRDADLALYEAKKAGRNRIVVFQADLGDRDIERNVLADLLDEAVERGELSAFLQPEVDGGSGRVVALEALARWCRPGRAPEPAGAFLDLARDPHVQTAIDLAVVEQAASAVATLDRERPDRPLGLRVNLARETLRTEGIAETLARIFRTAGVPPERVTVEFDTRDVDELQPAELEALDAIRGFGFGVGLDNVELPERFDIDPARRLRVGHIAIIPSVVARLGDDELADALFAGVVLALGWLGIVVTAVGVEDSQQADVVRRLGIRGQGRFFGDATTPEEIESAIDVVTRHAR